MNLLYSVKLRGGLGFNKLVMSGMAGSVLLKRTAF